MRSQRTLALAGLLLMALVAVGQAAPAATPTAPATAAAKLIDSQAFLERELAAAAAPPRAGTEQRVARLLAQMTLREKVGQMTQLEIGMVTTGAAQAIQIDPAKLHKAVVEYGVGSILNVKDEALPTDTWHGILRQIQATAAQTRLKVPILYGLDSIHGANYVVGATLFPQPLGMAATWNPELMLAASRYAAAETRAAGVPWNFSPVLDVGRMPLWPRLYETFGEDAYLATVMGVASVRGYQGDDLASPATVAACLKHYVGYSYPTTGHDRTPALIPPVTMREHFLPPFAAAVRAGAASVMVNSGEVNGVPGHVNRELLVDVLRGEMGFRGVVVSDWEDIKKLVNIHRVAADEKEATRLSVLAGIDMSMVPMDYSFADLLVELVEEGSVPIQRIDEAVSRILTLKAELGLFEDPLLGIDAGAAPGAVGGDTAHAVARQAARESVTLLKNEGGILPLAAEVAVDGARRPLRVLVAGPTADSRVALNNGWTNTWQGNREELFGNHGHTLLGALRERLGAERVTHVPGVTYDTEVDTPAAVAAARAADVVVLALGEMSYAETPGNIDDLALPPAQRRLARELAATGKPLVLVLLEGRPRILREAADLAQAIVLSYNPGCEGGRAIADVLAGEVNPSGKLPFTYPRDPNALRTYDHKAFEQQDQSFGLTAFRPQFEFGSGLSYTTFEYGELTVEPATAPIGAVVTVAVTVRNSGAREGAEVVQLYLQDEVASVTPAVKRLKRFAKVTLAPGESRRLTFRLAREDFAFVGAELRPIVEAGRFVVRVGGLAGEVKLEGTDVRRAAQ